MDPRICLKKIRKGAFRPVRVIVSTASKRKFCGSAFFNLARFVSYEMAIKTALSV